MNIMPEDQTTSLPAIQAHGTASQLFNIPIIFPSGKTGSMQIPRPLTDQEWDQLISILNVYKPSLISETRSEKENDKEEDGSE
jgi:hypothetical protein